MNLENNKPIVFLDFDGVVETIYWYETPEGLRMHNFSGHTELNNKQAIGWLNELYNKIPYNVVISSTWRMSMTVDKLQKLLINSGFNKNIKVIGKTDVLYQPRGLEIEKWLEDNHFKGKFIIIDDDSDMCHLMGNLIRTDCQLGFTIYDYQKALNMLK